MTRRRRIALAAAAVALAALAWVWFGPLPEDLFAVEEDVSTVVVDRSGVVLYEARSGRGTRSARLEPGSLPPFLADATIAAEDRRFRVHPGLDPLAVIRAAVRNVRAGAVVEGGSTITQQVAKLLLEDRTAREGRATRRGLRAKLQETLVAFRFRTRLTDGH